MKANLEWNLFDAMLSWAVITLLIVGAKWGYAVLDNTVFPSGALY